MVLNYEARTRSTCTGVIRHGYGNRCLLMPYHNVQIIMIKFEVATLESQCIPVKLRLVNSTRKVIESLIQNNVMKLTILYLHIHDSK